MAKQCKKESDEVSHLSVAVQSVSGASSTVHHCEHYHHSYTNFSNYTAWKWQLEKKNHDLAPELAAYTLTRSFSYASHQCGCDSLTPNCHIYTFAGGSQYYGHLRPTPEGSVRWYARRASSMCMCMSPRARWKMVHRSYLYMLSVSVMYKLHQLA